MVSMRRIFLVFLFLLAACKTPSFPAPLAPLPAGTPAPTFTPSPGFTVRYHPDGPLYVGDRVSIEILSPSSFKSRDQKARVSLDNPSGSRQVLGEADFNPFGIGGRSQATFYWIWDTHGLEPGVHTLRFALLPDGPSWTESVSLLPAADVPYPEPDAHWKSVETACCVIHYISGTDAERDIETLKTMADAEAADNEQRLQTELQGKIPLTFLPRVLGHGGFASDGIYVSYLDRNYAGGEPGQVAHHEMVHWLDGQMGGELRPTILVEGLAVFMSDGHFKTEPIFPRAAVLIELGWYIPLGQLTDAFYTSQHDIGYMEAGALVGYMIQTYGWERYNAFYRDIHPVKSGSQSGALQAALQTHFELSLDQLEENFTSFLRQQTVQQSDRTDVHLTVAFYDTVRRYQQALDPSAYFLTAWLPDTPEMRRRGIVGDYLRHPNSGVNERIESLLIWAEASLRAGDYRAAEADIRAANLLLDLLGNLQK
jgi:hypothetical protein